MSNKKLIAEVNGLAIKTNSVYKIVGKPDDTAPSGFVDLGVTKLPSDGISTSFECKYVITNQSDGSGLYDTGLYEDSPCYAGKDKAEVKETIKQLKKYLVDPYEAKYGKGVLHHLNEDFWSTTGRQTIAEGETLTTEDPDQLLKLYIAMRSYELTPKDLVGSPKFSQSQYVVEDREEVKTIKEERAEQAMEAIANFSALLKTNKSLLVAVLNYVRLSGITEDTSESTIKSAFYEWSQNKNNVAAFNDAYELASDVKTKDIILLYGVLQKAIAKKVVEYENGILFYQGRQLGGDLRTAAKNINSKADLEDVKLQLIEIK